MNIKDKRKEKSKEYEEKKLKECTFAPDISKSNMNKTLTNYIIDNNTYSIRAKIDLNKIMKEGNNLTFKPTIDEKSRSMISKTRRSNTPVYERLYELSSKGKESPQNNNELKLSPPKKLAKNQSNRVIKLYEEAKVRDINIQAKRKQMYILPKQKYNYISDPYVIRKYIKEFTYGLSTLNIDAKKDPWITFETMKDLMLELKFAPISANSDKNH